MNMTFFWGYHPDYWRGLARHGFLEGPVGVRLVQQPKFTPYDQTANVIVADGAPLAHLIEKNRYPLMIDRGCGGCVYAPFRFDQDILRRYESMLGDDFLGVQGHEWIGNFGTDWRRFEAVVGSTLPDDPEELTRVFGDRRLSWGTPADYAGRGYPASEDDALAEIQHHFRRKMKDFAGLIYGVNGFHQGYDLAFRMGARHVMAEVGCQTPLARVQVACARGAARAHSKRWGVYYETWGGVPFGVTSFSKRNLWNEDLAGQSFRHGENGGSSRALQRRVLYHAWLSGASTFAEEWGAENTFHDWQDHVLTPYGTILKQYWNFAERTERGAPITPIALVLDAEDGILDNLFLSGYHDNIMGLFRATPVQMRVREIIARLFGAVPKDFESERHVFTHGELPDAFDIIYSHTPPGKLARYGMLIYLGERSDRFRKQTGGYDGKVLIHEEPKTTLDTMCRTLKSVLPVWVSGDVHWAVNEVSDGLLVGLFNSDGVSRTAERGDRIDEDKKRVVEIGVKQPVGDARSISAGTGAREMALEPVRSGNARNLIVEVPAGGVHLVHLAL